MKKNVAVFIVMLLANVSIAQWTINGTNIYNSNTGNVGIGTSTPSTKLMVKDTITSNAGGDILLSKFDLTVKPTANYAAAGSRLALGGYATISSLNTTFSNDKITGVFGSSQNSGKGPVQELNGVNGWAYNAATSTVTNVRGGVLQSESDKGTVGELTGAFIGSYVFGGTVTSQYGIRVYDLTNSGGTVTNRYGLYMGAFTGSATNDFGLYQEGTSQKNYFAGQVGIGTTAPGPYQLAVEGVVGVRKLKVTQVTPWADYVFEPGYKLPMLIEVETFIKKHKHLPDVPSAADIKENGVDVGETEVLLLKKIEELTLYVISMQKEIKAQKKEIRNLKFTARRR